MILNTVKSCFLTLIGFIIGYCNLSNLPDFAKKILKFFILYLSYLAHFPNPNVK